MSRAILSETLCTIAQEQGRFERTFALVRRLVTEYGKDDLAERLYPDLPPDCPSEVASGLYHALFWVFNWNGGGDDRALMETMEEWLRTGEDVRKMRIALNLEVYPFERRAEMERVLRRIATRYPELAERCRELIAARRKAGV